MGFFRDWFDRTVKGGPTEMEELMNPVLGWRLQHFVCIPEDREHWLRHYFMFLDKEKARREFIVFYAQTAVGWSYERTAYRKQGEDGYSLLSERGPWSMTISSLLELGRQLPANTQSPNGHHAAGVSIERRPAPQPEPPPRPAPQPEPPKAALPEPKPAPKFAVGEHVVYPQHGVGKITAIKPDMIDGEMFRVLVIHFKTANMTLHVPVENAGKVGLRKLADEL
ncbi:CarD family transcriptional regulator [Bradyrhizobium sp. A5]|uniref:CarD family transcriptional regulator n=1 Tax=Bradyrhizobium sp. A5 TaxID=3133696 RepID=UPI003253E1F8